MSSRPIALAGGPSYGRLDRSSSAVSSEHRDDRKWGSRTVVVRLVLIAAILLVAAGATLTISVSRAKKVQGRPVEAQPSRAITGACKETRYPELCVRSLVEFPGAMGVSRSSQLVHMTVNMTLQRFGSALSRSAEIGNWDMDSMARSAYDDCVELLEESVDLLARSLITVADASSNQGGSKEDVLTWLSAALTNQDTCTEGLSTATGAVKGEMSVRLRDLSELVSNCLAIYAGVGIGTRSDDFAGVPIGNRRLMTADVPYGDRTGFPDWLLKDKERLLLLVAPSTAPAGHSPPPAKIQADVVVAKDGTGTVKTITEAIKMAPQQSTRRFIIYIKAGRYEESNLKVGRKKTNLWFIGEGRGQTVITGGRNVGHDKITTFHTATFAATGAGFVAKDISFENYAGPGSHQAVALRVGSDHAVVYQCEIKGYQDTLYAHSQRQFYRDCDIYGTVDFIFGNAAVVFQHCNLRSRKPLPQQKITITAQNRKDPNQNTGMSIHVCQVVAAGDLEAVKSSYPTFLGRPWKPFSRVVYMESYIGDHVDPQGWLAWNGTSPVDKLYYGEFDNNGPRADTSHRVRWPGVHLDMSRQEASKFTVAQFIFGSAWLSATGVSFQAGLTS